VGVLLRAAKYSHSRRNSTRKEYAKCQSLTTPPSDKANMVIGWDHVLSIAGALKKAGGSWKRRLGLTGPASGWESRAAVCERCHLRVIQCGVSYCGKPFLHQILRTDAIDGCGCPCQEKAKTPGEHCPLDIHNHPANHAKNPCNCKWCNAA